MNLQRFAKLLLFVAGPLLAMATIGAMTWCSYVPDAKDGINSALETMTGALAGFCSLATVASFFAGAVIISEKGWDCSACKRHETEIAKLRDALTETRKS